MNSYELELINAYNIASILRLVALMLICIMIIKSTREIKIDKINLLCLNIISICITLSEIIFYEVDYRVSYSSVSIILALLISFLNVIFSLYYLYKK